MYILKFSAITGRMYGWTLPNPPIPIGKNTQCRWKTTIHWQAKRPLFAAR